ncbi:purine/pyrimidine permease [Brevibacillus dissolubilis]|uniref:purine/pyrimidine permease n=1 Tax=Brevibacillus dissolubilis TaxID=1844116 RepID=UPI0011175B43|nr:purine/pyrimidine permease [Brevibacillus dissolubilis]
MKYGLYDKPPLGVTVLSTLQWLIVTLSSSIVVPIVIGDVYGLTAGETGEFMQQTIFYIGVASLLQVWLGHRYPMMDGPAGLWWGIFLIMANIGGSMGLEPRIIGQSMQGGLIVAGALFVVLGMTGIISRIQQWFTPIVTGTYMTLLAVSLCSTFVKGMLGIGFHQSELVRPEIAMASVVIIALVILFMQIPRLASFAVLLGMVIGWGAYALLGWADQPKPAQELVVWPKVFFWGPVHWDAGILVTCVLTGFVLLTNLITSLVVVGRAVNQVADSKQYNRGGVYTGVSHLLAGFSGVVGMIPLSLAAAVIQATKLASKLPFILAMVLMMGIGIFPTVSQVLAAMPTPVAYAAMFVAYTQLLGFGLKDFARIQLDERAITVIGSSLLVGIGIMFVPPGAWQSLHPLLSFLLGNGLLLGVLVALFMEHVVFRVKKDQEGQQVS